MFCVRLCHSSITGVTKRKEDDTDGSDFHNYPAGGSFRCVSADPSQTAPARHYGLEKLADTALLFFDGNGRPVCQLVSNDRIVRVACSIRPAADGRLLYQVYSI